MNKLQKSKNFNPKIKIKKKKNNPPNGNKKCFYKNKKTLTNFSPNMHHKPQIKKIPNNKNNPKKKVIKNNFKQFMKPTKIKTLKAFQINLLINQIQKQNHNVCLNFFKKKTLHNNQ